MCRTCCDIDGLQMRDVSTCSTSTTYAEGSCCNDADPPLNSKFHRKPNGTKAFANGFMKHRHVNSTVSRIQDIEEGLSQPEHLTLRFQGSNCPACISKISTTLGKLTYVHNIQINAILKKIDFDIDVSRTPANDAIQSIQKLIGQPCQRIGDGFQQLDLVLPGFEGQVSDFSLPPGVKDIIRKNKSSYCVRYDAKVIGARQLLKALSRSPERPAALLPVPRQSDMPSDIRMLAYKTSLSFLLTCPIIVLSWAPLPPHPIIYDAVSLALASVIQVVIVGPLCMKAFRSFCRSRRIDMDILIVLSTSLAYAFSVASFVCEVKHTRWSSGLYFETSALLISFIMVGRLMSDFACYRSLKSIPVKSIQPQTATLVDGNYVSAPIESEIDARLLHLGDVFLVRRGCPAVTDGMMISGESEFDESVVTGEARLVKKEVGSTVIAGSINRLNDILVQVVQLPGQNTIDEIAGLVESVMHTKPKVQQIADRIAGWIVPIVSVLALLTLGAWSIIGVLYLRKPIDSAILDAVPYTIAVLVVTCPCALILAVPIVLIVASSIAVKNGFVFTSAEALQIAKDITHVVFDKTGTLTEERMSVVSEEYYSQPRSLTAALVLALTCQSEHPMSCAVTKHLQSAGYKPILVKTIDSIVGSGIKCTWNGQTVKIGNARWLGMESSPAVRDLLSRNLSVLCVTQEGLLTATYGIEAPLRKEASTVVTKLMERGLSVSILSGDEIGSVDKVAAKLRISRQNIKARCSPLDKQVYVKELIEKHGNTVLFCGDGVNDAAALAQASLGLQIHNSHTTARFSENTANAMLLTPSLSGILVLLELSADAHRQIIFSLSWAAVYNVFAILLAAGAFVKVRLPAEYAGLGEAVSVLPVILMPLCLKWKIYR